MMPLAMIITPIPMGTRVQSDYIKGWMVAVLMYVGTQGLAEYGMRVGPMRPTPLGAGTCPRSLARPSSASWES